MTTWARRGYGAATVAAGVPVRFDNGLAMVPLWAAVVVDAGLPPAEAQRVLLVARYDADFQAALQALDGLTVDLLRPTVAALAKF